MSKKGGFFSRILKPLVDEELHASISEYLETTLISDRETRGPFFGKILFFLRASQILISLVFENIGWRFSMLKNYMVTLFRNIKRHKVYSFINIAGLSIGLACCLFIFLFIRDELSFDRFHTRFDRIYRVLTETYNKNGTSIMSPTALPLAPALKAELPEVTSVARYSHKSSYLVGTDNKFFYEKIIFADPEFLEIFSFPLIDGNPKTALSEPNTIVITEMMAKKYFRNEDPLDKILTLQDAHDFKVTGVLQNIPLNSHIRFDFLASFSTLNNTPRVTQWTHFSNDYTYVLLPEGVKPAELEEKFPAVLKKYLPTDAQGEYGLRLQSLREIRFSSLRYDVARTSEKTYMYVYPAIGLFILLIACINFMNLSTARSSRRAKEVGLRKVMGARRSQIIRQFFAESIGTTFFSLVLAGFLVKLFLPRLNSFIRKEMAFDPFHDPALLAGLLGLCLVVGVISGSYPALFLSSFQPAQVLKKKILIKGKRFSFRTVTVVFQFVISILLFIGTMTVYNQLHFMKNRELGFLADQVLVLQIEGSPIEKNFEAFRNEIIADPTVASATISSGTPASGSTIHDSFTPEGFEEGIQKSMQVLFTDFDFVKTYGLELVSGRDFSRSYATDKTRAALINETAVREFNWDSPLGKQIKKDTGEIVKVIGVVKDFHYDSLHSRIEPMLIALYGSVPQYISIRVLSENFPLTLGFLEKIWKNFAPRNPFSYFFIDDEFETWYAFERRLGTIFSICAMLAVFISCLGIFGLASFSAEQRTKEIGIRKVLGASVSGIFGLLSREFLRWILIANILAWPAAYYVMGRWLRNFPYRVSMGLWMFMLAAMAALVLALLTVSYQSIKAATANPVDSLRYE